MQVYQFVYLYIFVHVPREYGKYIYNIRLKFSPDSDKVKKIKFRNMI